MFYRHSFKLCLLIAICIPFLLGAIHIGFKSNNECFSTEPLIKCVPIDKKGHFWNNAFNHREVGSK